jgi:hypothetical protein
MYHGNEIHATTFEVFSRLCALNVSRIDALPVMVFEETCNKSLNESTIGTRAHG